MLSILGLVNTRFLSLISEILELTTYLDQNHKDAEQGQFSFALNKVDIILCAKILNIPLLKATSHWKFNGGSHEDIVY